jgi:hypothetical protein
MVKLPLGNVYPGSVTMLVVEVWADTSDVFRVYPLGVGGDLSQKVTHLPSTSVQSPEPTISSSPRQTVSSILTVQPSDSVSPQTIENSKPMIATVPLAVLASLAAVIVTAVLAAFFHKRKAE